MKTVDYEVIIIGGSYAGLSSAMALGRSLRKTLIIDSGKPCNEQTPHSHNFVTHDGKKPSEIAQQAKEQVLQYSSVTFTKAKAMSGTKMEDYFIINTDTNETFSAKKLIFATGIKDIMPEITGFSECWGISVIHCPYCHGYEYKKQPTGLFASGDKAMHMAGLIRNLTDKLTIFASENSFTEEQLQKLAKNEIEVKHSALKEIVHTDGYLHQIILENGESIALNALYAPRPFTQHCSIPEKLGCKLNEQGYLETDATMKTVIPGVYACGDNVFPMRSVASAIAQGNLAGAMVNMELVQESF
ncbi:Thioredoxin reductase [Pustulibacterium marinum]|uniref:Thioredoxin reductase n=1 Tax=Pustulibacterium marinum TaxID=1224947 RepID=A0A1I7IT93_9FLAO|nr:NAD(P)/FAD-dependent oxidoreductase [Pustulibacterium marinum]SFU76140.1 Thioredoxin reductase [Pustulibacterium marinum]